MVDLERLFASDTKFSNALVSEVMQWPLKKNNPFHPITKGYSLFSAVEILALSEAKRVPVIDANSQVADVVTQSMMIDFLWQNIEMIGKLAEKKIQDIQILRNHVVTQVDESSKAIVAFREMVNRQEDHVAVVNKSGQLVDNLSLRDLRVSFEPKKSFGDSHTVFRESALMLKFSTVCGAPWLTSKPKSARNSRKRLLPA